MASNAVSSVQFRVNGTETARDGHAKLNARGERTLACWVAAGELPNSYCVNDRTAGTSDDGGPRRGISNSRQLARGRARRCRRLRHGCESLYRRVLSNFRRPIQSQPRTRCLRPSTHQHFPNRHFRLGISPPDRPIAVTRTSCEMPKILAFALHSDSSC